MKLEFLVKAKPFSSCIQLFSCFWIGFALVFGALELNSQKLIVFVAIAVIALVAAYAFSKIVFVEPSITGYQVFDPENGDGKGNGDENGGEGLETSPSPSPSPSPPPAEFATPIPSPPPDEPKATQTPSPSPPPDGSPTPTPTGTPTPTATPTGTPTPTPTVTPTPGVTPSPGISPTPGASPGPSPSPMPTPEFEIKDKKLIEEGTSGFVAPQPIEEFEEVACAPGVETILVTRREVIVYETLAHDFVTEVRLTLLNNGTLPAEDVLLEEKIPWVEEDGEWVEKEVIFITEPTYFDESTNTAKWVFAFLAPKQSKTVSYIVWARVNAAAFKKGPKVVVQRIGAPPATRFFAGFQQIAHFFGAAGQKEYNFIYAMVALALALIAAVSLFFEAKKPF